MNYLLVAVTPETIISTAIVALAYAAFLWNVVPRVMTQHVIGMWVIGAAFIATTLIGRYVGGTPRWDFWIGVLLLWTWYSLVAWVSVLVYRRWR